jgi:hypothetical protein
MNPGSQASTALLIVGIGLLTIGICLLIAALMPAMRRLISWPRRYSGAMLLLGLMMLTLSSFCRDTQQTQCHALCQAIDAGNDQLVVEMIKRNPSLRSCGFDVLTDDLPLLHRAIRSRRLAIMMIILSDENLNLEQKDAQGRTPLVYALEQQQRFMVATLLCRHANKLAKAPDGRTATELAQELGEDYFRLFQMP